MGAFEEGYKLLDEKVGNGKDNVITAYLEWYHLDQGRKVTRLKGIGLFVMEGGRILKRHNYIYCRNNVW